MIGVTFGEKHSYDDFGLVLTNIANTPPTPQTETVTVVGRNGALDLTGALLDEVKYNSRKITYTFQLVHDLSTWADVFSSVQNYLHGQKLTVVQDDDVGYYWYGRCTVDSYASSKRLGTLVISVDADPYKLQIADASEWEWDPFSFVDGVIYTTYVEVDGELTINLVNDAMPVSPTFTVSADMTVTYDGETYDLEEGTTTVTDIRLQEGDNYMTLTGTGTVTISYIRGSL